jgi:hypothetical protein
MEKFKACEKEMKTKAFSKEGLTQASKLDAKQQEKLEATQWLQGQVEELTLQVEAAEAEIETLQGGPKKKHKGGQQTERLETLDHLNDRRKWHISRLELILRLLDNGTMTVDSVNGLKEDVSYFVESNMVCNHVPTVFETRLTPHHRTRTSTKMRAFMMNSTWTKKRRSSGWLKMIKRAMTLKMRAKVWKPCSITHLF